jgi:tellurite resistance protein TehA-like permease
MNWYFLFALTALVFFTVYIYLRFQQNNKKKRIATWTMFCVASIFLGCSAIIRLKEVLPQNDNNTLILETIVLIVSIIGIGKGISVLKEEFTNNYDSQK